MAVQLKHQFVSAKADGPDTTQVQPSNWNADHELTMATARLLGRTTASTGPVEEISVGATLSLSAGVLALATNPTVGGVLTVSGNTALSGQLSVALTSTFTGNATFSGNAGVGGAAPASAAFSVTSTTKGALLPRMTTAQRDAIASPATGLLIYNTTTDLLEVYSGAWGPVGPVVGVDAQAQSTNLTQLAAPTYVRGDIIRRGASALERLALGPDKQSMVSNGTDALWGYNPTFHRFTAVAVSGTEVDFNDIPSWVNHVRLVFRRTSLSGTEDTWIRLGTSGGLLTSGYEGDCLVTSGSLGTSLAFSAAFAIGYRQAAGNLTGTIDFTKADGSFWVATGTLRGSTATTFSLVGSIALSGQLDRLRIMTSGSNTFDAGAVVLGYNA
jgi:hypothetical protein